MNKQAADIYSYYKTGSYSIQQLARAFNTDTTTINKLLLQAQRSVL